jgi:hypothetical protein
MEDAVRHESDQSQYNQFFFNHVLIQNTPFISKDIKCGPLAEINDGYNDIIIQPATAGKCRLANMLIQ